MNGGGKQQGRLSKGYKYTGFKIQMLEAPVPLYYL
jgi:hypothetical protein